MLLLLSYWYINKTTMQHCFYIFRNVHTIVVVQNLTYRYCTVLTDVLLSSATGFYIYISDICYFSSLSENVSPIVWAFGILMFIEIIYVTSHCISK